eukprot:12198-Rhodomonas_salina.1
MSPFLAPRVHRKASAGHPGSDQADDVESWVLSFTDAGPQSGPFLIILALLDPDGKRSGAVMVEQNVANVNG